MAGQRSWARRGDPAQVGTILLTTRQLHTVTVLYCTVLYCTVTRWHYSRDHRLVLGLAWLPPTAHTANQFLHRVHQLMDCPENVGLSGPR